MASLTGKVALVTGAGQGVGQGIAFALAEAGAAVALAGRTQAKVEASAKTITERGGRALAISCDVFKPEDITRTVQITVEALGGLDILVNNAYDGAFGPLLSLDDEAFMRGIHSGPLASFRFMRACHPHLKARGGGNIVNLVTSASVRWDSSNYGAYAVAKQGIRALTRAAAHEWGRDNIRVNNIAPLAASPALAAWIKHDPEAKTFFETVALKRVGDCEADIGRAVVALVGAQMGYVTGATLPLDGGQAYFG
ncbi:MAG TPA: SDR family oxidoreductase [Steroidobacteraceae bacterium]|nr:SDR family oxidoreductase [Steroidobacteraceae bacterium]